MAARQARRSSVTTRDGRDASPGRLIDRPTGRADRGSVRRSAPASGARRIRRAWCARTWDGSELRLELPGLRALTHVPRDPNRFHPPSAPVPSGSARNLVTARSFAQLATMTIQRQGRDPGDRHDGAWRCCPAERAAVHRTIERPRRTLSAGDPPTVQNGTRR